MANNWLEKYRHEIEGVKRAASEALAPLSKASLPSPRRVLIDARHVVAASPARVEMSGQVCDLPRICSVHNLPWAARYIRQANGSFALGQTIRVTKRLWAAQYRDNAIPVTVDQIDEEECPWCGAFGTAILCAKCKAEFCHGRASQDGLAYCSCGNFGAIRRKNRDHKGVTPKIAAKGQYRL